MSPRHLRGSDGIRGDSITRIGKLASGRKHVIELLESVANMQRAVGPPARRQDTPSASAIATRSSVRPNGFRRNDVPYVSTHASGGRLLTQRIGMVGSSPRRSSAMRRRAGAVGSSRTRSHGEPSNTTAWPRSAATCSKRSRSCRSGSRIAIVDMTPSRLTLEAEHGCVRGGKRMRSGSPL
jgi:hypothetical protein